MDFRTLLEEIGGASNPTIKQANAASIPSDYMLARILPEEEKPDYNVSDSSIVVRSVAAALVGMDSVFPEGVIVESTEFNQKTYKLGHRGDIKEQQLRTIQSLLQRIQLAGGSDAGDRSKEFLANELFNFQRKVLLQPHYDTAEYFRSQALTTGAISYTQNNIVVNVSYTGIPSANKFATRTTASTQAYGAAGSVWWSDLRSANRLLRGGIALMVAHENTIWEIVENPANNITLIGQEGGIFKFVRHTGTAAENPSTDKRETVTMVAYNKETTIRNPIDNVETNLPYMPEGYVTIVGSGNVDEGYRPGQGTGEDPYAGLRVGHTHIGPTTEQNGATGRYSKIFTPENSPWALRGESASNIMVVIENGRKLVILSTEMA